MIEYNSEIILVKMVKKLYKIGILLNNIKQLYYYKLINRFLSISLTLIILGEKIW